jgi:hypothetical protein
MNICIRYTHTPQWTSSVSYIIPAMRAAYVGYKERPHYYRERPYTNGEYIVYRPDNDPYLPTYIARMDAVCPEEGGGAHLFTSGNGHITQATHDTMEQNGVAMPIIDLADISVFTTESAVLGGTARANWFPSREYQAWAYRDFVYDRHRSIKKSYVSRNTPPAAYSSDVRILANQIVTLPDANIGPNVVFNLSRTENGSVVLTRNDAAGSQTRICDNEYARAGYLGFYTRITMDPGIIVLPPPQASLLSTAHLPAPEETDDDDDDDEHQCTLCVRYRVNARFSPCNHAVCCSQCYSQFLKNECPVCRVVITRVMNI